LFGERASSDGRARRNYPGRRESAQLRGHPAATHSGEHYAEWDDFSLAQAVAEKPVTRRLHIAFYAPSRALVDALGRHAGDDGERAVGAGELHAFRLLPFASAVEAHDPP
jgi:hypothetical protein